MPTNDTRGLWRGKRLYNDEWALWCLIRSNSKAMILVLDENTNRMSGTAVDPSTLGECTGLTDKNGKLIFEGDIIAYEDETPGQYEYHDSLFINRGIIKFGDGQFYFTNSIAATMDDLLNSGILDCEVIGNIHDNPELLKGADKP